MPRRSNNQPQALKRAQIALTHALQNFNHEAVVVRSRVAKRADNLCPGVIPEQFELDLSRGAGDELHNKFRAPYSSAALAVNTFARFKGFESDLHIGKWSGFESLKFEQEFSTGLRGTPPHLDVVLSGPNRTLAIESKCTEHLGTKEPFFKDAYERLLESNRQSKPWLDEMVAIRKGRHRYEHLDVAQLIKHAFGIAQSCEDRTAYLLYLYWEPMNTLDVRELNVHRRELAAFEKRVVGGVPRFRAMTYRQLWAQWGRTDRPAWLHEHVGNLRRRYEVEI